VNGHDFEFEEFEISEAVGLPFHGFDFVIGSFKRSCGNGIVVIGQDAGPVSSQGMGELDERAGRANLDRCISGKVAL